MKQIQVYDTVQKLKALVEKMTGIFSSEQQIFARDRLLSENDCLSNYSEGNHILRLTLLITKPHKMVIFVKLPDHSVWPIQVMNKFLFYSTNTYKVYTVLCMYMYMYIYCS